MLREVLLTWQIFMWENQWVAITLGSEWKTKRAADWEESAEWKSLTTSLGPSVEQLQEKFRELDMRGMEEVRSPGWATLGMEV